MDDVDQQIIIDSMLDKFVTNDIREKARSIPLGHPGNCDMCGEWTGRLVGGACAPCRDLYKLP